MKTPIHAKLMEEKERRQKKIVEGVTMTKCPDQSSPETPLDNVLDAEFEKYLDQKKTLRRDFKMNGQRFRDCVVYVLCSLNIEPNFGNFRKYDPVLDWEQIGMNDLRRKGIV